MTLRGVNIAACWYDDEEGRHYEIRSRDDSNAGQLAIELGGGGHRHAAGFTIQNIPTILPTE
jgi:nanoRNase/pAp phosphatase (c-di-AMP/oligoRNAs hydrolase)